MFELVEVPRPMTTGETFALGGLILNVAVIVWGASKLSSSVEYLKEAMVEVKGLVSAVKHTVSTTVARVAVLEERSGHSHHRSTDDEARP